MMATIVFVKGQVNCPNEDNYAPCTCSGGSTSLPIISCNGVPLETILDIFAQTDPVSVPIRLSITLSASETVAIVPANLLGNKVASTITINCPLDTFELTINSNAFSSSSGNATSIVVNKCNLVDSKLAFFTSFTELVSLTLTGITNLQSILPTLPYPLPSLSSLNFFNSRGWNEIDSLPQVLINGLTALDMGSSLIEDVAMNKILDWIVKSSNSSLKTIYIDQNKLTKVPQQISAFTVLENLHLENNEIASISATAFSFTAPIVFLSLDNNLISEIPAGAFKGK